jgi:hypothetical protein
MVLVTPMGPPPCECVLNWKATNYRDLHDENSMTEFFSVASHSLPIQHTPTRWRAHGGDNSNQ